jgi:parvulin-like peptidyl-prolyl isomerase
MKYLYYIVFVFVAVSVAAGYFLTAFQTPSPNAALIINDRVITTDELNNCYASIRPDIKDRDNFINSMITKELLIQESQRSGIDKEEAFRKSIQDYYEQSLIKLLMDRKLAGFNVSVSDEELDRYVPYLNKKILLSIFSFEDLDKAKSGRYRRVEQKTSSFEDLSNEIKDQVVHLKKGEMSQPVKSGDVYITLRIDSVDSQPSPALSQEERERTRNGLLEAKKEKMINDWFADLRNKARIKISDAESRGKR